jgi:hypothetical protein
VSGGKTVAGGNVPIGTQLPKTSLWYPIRQEGNNCPSASLRLKGGVVVNTAVNIVTVKAAANSTFLLQYFVSIMLLLVDQEGYLAPILR